MTQMIITASNATRYQCNAARKQGHTGDVNSQTFAAVEITKGHKLCGQVADTSQWPTTEGITQLFVNIIIHRNEQIK